MATHAPHEIDPCAQLSQYIQQLDEQQQRNRAVKLISKLIKISPEHHQGEVRQYLLLRSVAFQENLLDKLLDVANKEGRKDSDTSDAIISIVDELTEAPSVDVASLRQIDKSAYRLARAEPKASELGFYKAQPAFVSLALHAVASCHDESHVANNFLEGLMHLEGCSTEVCEQLLSLLRDPGCADAMWACISSPDLVPLSIGARTLKIILGGKPKANETGLWIPGEEASNHRPHRVLIHEFIALGGAEALGTACSTVASLTRASPKHEDANQSTKQANSREARITTRWVLLECFNLLAAHGTAAAALAAKPLQHWPVKLIQGHAELVLTVSCWLITKIIYEYMMHGME